MKKLNRGKLTSLNEIRVADNIAECLYDPTTGRLRKPGLILAHATSTPVGDPEEAKALYRVFGEELRDIDLTALKSYIGHLLGGSGSFNIAAAVQSIMTGEIPHILNLENPDPKIPHIEDFNFVEDNFLYKPVHSVLAPAYGFGGFASSVLIEKYIPRAA